MSRLRSTFLIFTLALSAQPLLAGFSDTDVVIPAVSRAPGGYLSDWYSQIWITNLGSQPVTYQASFYQRDQSNLSPHTFSDTLGPSETKRYDNVVENLFGLSGVSGAVRVTASGPFLVSSRTYNLPPSGNVRDNVGLFFTGVPTTFAIGPGETSQLQGITQGWSALSDLRTKTEVRDVPLGLDFVMALRPVEYRLCDSNRRLDIGFVAQEIEAQRDEIDSLKARLQESEDVRGRLSELEARLSRVEARAPSR